MTAVVIYGAKSSPDEKESVADQQRIVNEAIEREGDRELVGVFGEANQSGYRKSRGPQLEAAIQAAIAAADEYGEAELWVFHSTRLGRGTGRKGQARALGKLLYDLQERGVTVRSVGDDSFTTNEQLWSIASSQASKYSEDLGTHTKRGISKRQRAGKPFGGVPCGYRRELTVVDDTVLSKRVIDPDTAATVETIWSMIEAGESWGPIARALNARGLRTQRGNPWTGAVVRDLAKNRLYLGEKGYPALIEQDRWGRIQALIDASTPVGRQRRQGGRPLNVDRFLLRGLAFCAHCGSPMHVRSDKRGYYTCRAQRRGTGLCDAKGIPAPIADERVLHHLDTFIASVEGWIAGRVRECSDEHAAREQALRQELHALGDLERLRAKLMAEYERQVDEGKSTAYLALEAVERKDRDLEQQRREIDAAEAQLSEWRGAPDADQALDYYNDLVSAIRGRVSGASGVGAVNAALSTIVAGIWLGYDGKQLTASFALRPLDRRDDASLAVQLLSGHGEGWWPLPPKPDTTGVTKWALGEKGDNDESQAVAGGTKPRPGNDERVDQPATQPRSSRFSAAAGCSRPP